MTEPTDASEPVNAPEPRIRTEQQATKLFLGNPSVVRWLERYPRGAAVAKAEFKKKLNRWDVSVSPPSSMGTRIAAPPRAARQPALRFTTYRCHSSRAFPPTIP